MLRKQHRESRKMKMQRNTFQIKNNNNKIKHQEINLNEMEISDLLDEEFKIMVIKMFMRSGE